MDPLKLASVCPSPMLNDQHLKRVEGYNYLGVSIDGKLDFDKYLREKYDKLHSRMHKLGHMRKYIGSHTANVIYKQMILSLSEYGDVMIKSGPQNDIHRLNKLHDRAIKIIDNRQHPKATLANLRLLYQIPSIGVRRDEHLCSLMYRY